MKRILYIKSSLNRDNGTSSELGAELVHRLARSHPGSTVTVLDLVELNLPHLGAEEFASWSVNPSRRSEKQAAMAAISDRLIEQLLDHDTLVLAVPMYNMSIPSTLKAWIDRVVRAGRTFLYTAEGPQGLVAGIEAYAVFARGGMYRGTPLDTQTDYIKAILGLIGIRNVSTVFAEGLAMGDDQRGKALNEARQAISSVTGGQPGKEVCYATA